VARFDLRLAVVAGDFVQRKEAFGLVADVDDDFRRGELDDAPADDVALVEVRHLLVVDVEQLVHAESFEVPAIPRGRGAGSLVRIIGGRHLLGHLRAVSGAAAWIEINAKLLIRVEIRSLARKVRRQKAWKVRRQKAEGRSGAAPEPQPRKYR